MLRHELILGGQRSGKSRCAESRAAGWLRLAGRSATLLATAREGDGEMRERIARHRADRLRALPALRTVEVPLDLPTVIRQHSAPECMLVVECLTLWLTNLLMPSAGTPVETDSLLQASHDLCSALRVSSSPVVLVSNEIGLGVSPMTREARIFVDELGRLHQAVAEICDSVTLMVAGIEMPVKRPVP